MLRIENFEVMGWEHAIRGMRNPMNSWKQSDTNYHAPRYLYYADNDVMCMYDDNGNPYVLDKVEIGPNDKQLMKTLRIAGTDHRKYMRMITVYLDITAPLYWWKEFDTYKVGTVANSCSTMHKIHDKEFTLEDFSHEHLIGFMYDSDEWVYDNIREERYHPELALTYTIKALNFYRNKYLETKVKPMKEEAKRASLKKHYWWQMIQLLPSSYNQKRTVMLNYEVLANIYKSRRNHKLDEWHVLCDWIEKLPYSELITGPDIKDIPIAKDIMEEAERRVIAKESITVCKLCTLHNYNVTDDFCKNRCHFGKYHKDT